MATPAAVLSILVKTQGAAAAAAELRGVDSAARGANSNLGTMQGHAKKTGGALRSLGGMAKGTGVLVGAVGLAKGVHAAVDEFREAQKVGAQTNAVLKSTGGAANVTKTQIESLSNAISRKSGIDDEAIQSSANLLLTFTNVRNEVGKGNDIFNQATQTVTDMSVALGQSGKSSAIQLGKALQDPIKGATALRRVGVMLTDQQKEQITTLVAHGDKLGAQKIILKELTREFGGSAAAQATASDKMNVALSNLAEAAGRVLVPQINKAVVAVTRFTNEMMDGRGAGGRFASTMRQLAAALAPLLSALGAVAGAIASVTRWLARASANVSLFIEDIRDGTRQTGSFGSSLHRAYVILRDVAGAIRSVLVWVGKLAGRLAGGVIDTIEDFAGGIAKIANAAKDAVDWIKKIHFPKIKIPSIPNPFKGGPVDFGPSGKLGQMPVSGVDQFNPIASKFGLALTSGYRPGDPGYHGLNRARDYSNGVSTPQEMSFAKYMAATYGSRLKELIHTPLGYGIKNGARVPLSFWGPKTNAMHYNHVHVAFASGGRVPGAGTGDKIPALLESGEFVVNRRAARAYGPQLMAMNDSVPRFASGGWALPDLAATLLSTIDLRQQAGDISAVEALSQKIAALNDFIGQATGNEQLQFRAQQAQLQEELTSLTTVTVDNTDSNQETTDSNQALIDAQNEAAEAANAAAEATRLQTEAINALHDEMEKQNNFATSVNAVSLGAAWKAMADLISGQIYGQVSQKAATAGSGVGWRF